MLPCSPSPVMPGLPGGTAISPLTRFWEKRMRASERTAASATWLSRYERGGLPLGTETVQKAARWSVPEPALQAVYFSPREAGRMETSVR